MILIFFILSVFNLSTVNAFETPYIPMGSARTKKAVIAFPEFRSHNKIEASLSQSISETVLSDLKFMDIFNFLNPSAYIEDSAKSGITSGTFKFTDWTAIGAEYLIKSEITVNSSHTVNVDAYLYDTKSAKQIFSKKYISTTKEAKVLAHTFANDIVFSLTGLPGIFLTKIAMSCDMTGKKEIYIMNYDGSEAKQVTKHRSIAFAPAWSPDGTRLAYSLFTRHQDNIKNIDLFEFNFITSSVRLLSNRRGINSGAAYSPDGKKIALTLSYLGNPEIFILDPETRQASQITRSLGFDVDPSWKSDGKSIAFVSSRTGMPMVFSMDAKGQNPQRLTYAGRYNATPTWSPQTGKLAFSGWIDKNFDIFIMNADGTHIERLTKNQSNNEDPFFSPDGNFLIFSSNRTGQKNIYVMNVDGSFVKRLTYGLGNCVAPKWSNPPTPTTSPNAK